MKRLPFLFALITMVACKPDPSFTNNDGHSHNHYNLNMPAGLPPMFIPADNPMTVEGVALGKKLFYEPRLSANNAMSCASCHQFKNYFVDSNKQFSTGVDNIAGTRNSMPLFNIGYAKKFFWDGGATDLESQVIGPIMNPIEMHETMGNVISKLQADAEYPSLFKKAFGSDIITSKMIMQAVAQFERTMISANSKYDKYKRGELSLTAQEMRGLAVYLDDTKGDCVHCHTIGSTFTDFDFRNTGLDSIPIDKGRGLITLLPSDDGKFKTPSLRNIEMTSPYMHDGRFTTLRQCIEHYNKNFKYTANLATELKVLPKNRMTEADIDDLIAFLQTLTDTEFLNKIELDKE
ncbi:MAG: c-type cytochrome [Bacteroidetes bacterium]|nr:c-type cytochrome [Bacteroidota bacterium]